MKRRQNKHFIQSHKIKYITPLYDSPHYGVLNEIIQNNYTQFPDFTHNSEYKNIIKSFIKKKQLINWKTSIVCFSTFTPFIHNKQTPYAHVVPYGS